MCRERGSRACGCGSAAAAEPHSSHPVRTGNPEGTAVWTTLRSAPPLGGGATAAGKTQRPQRTLCVARPLCGEAVQQSSKCACGGGGEGCADARPRSAGRAEPLRAAAIIGKKKKEACKTHTPRHNIPVVCGLWRLFSHPSLGFGSLFALFFFPALTLRLGGRRSGCCMLSVFYLYKRTHIIGTMKDVRHRLARGANPHAASEKGGLHLSHTSSHMQPRHPGRPSDPTHTATAARAQHATTRFGTG